MASGNTLAVLLPQGNQPTATNFAQLDSYNLQPCLAFDASTNWDSVLAGVLNRAYAGGGTTVTIWFTMVSATSGNLRFKGAWERYNAGTTSLGSDNFATAVNGSTTAVPGTAGIVQTTTIVFTDGTQMNSTAAGEGFRLKITRDTAVASNAAGNARLFRVEIKET